MARRRFLVALALAVGYLGIWFVLGLFLGVAPNEPPENPAPPQLPESGTENIGWGIWVLWGGLALLMAIFLGLAGYAAVRLVRQRGVRFEDLDSDEQRRREEAGRLLHDL